MPCSIGENINTNRFRNQRTGTLQCATRSLFRLDHGLYERVFWVEQPLDANGKKRKDVKNPDEKLRNVDIDKVVIVRGLKYDKDDKEWGNAKIYDPSKGIRVNVTAEFVSPKKLKLRGTILGIGTTIYWTKLK